jgi:DUF4097 and DUF4098 domain-containing protein YvlB
MSQASRRPTVVSMPFSRPIRALVLAGGLGAAIILAATGCGLVWNTLSDGLVQDAPVTEVRISGGSGDITVIGDATTGVDVRRTVRYVGETKPGQTMSVSGGVLIVNTDCGLRCSASYEVHVSKGVKLTGKNDSGAVHARGVSDVDIELDSGDIEIDGATGSVAAKADSGRVRVTDVGGAATLSADSGDVEVDNVAGRLSVTVGSGRIEATGIGGDAISLETDSGDISATLRNAANVTARADSGQVTLTVPDNCCRVEANAGSGHEEIRVRQNSTSGYLLTVRTGSGDITIRPAT